MMRTVAMWYLRFLLACALLGLVAGMIKAFTGINLTIGYTGSVTLAGIDTLLPTANTALMTMLAALIAMRRTIRLARIK